VYTTLITGPRRAGEHDGAEEFPSGDPGQRPVARVGDAVPRVVAVHPLRGVPECVPGGIAASADMRMEASIRGDRQLLTPLYDSVKDNPHLPHASSLCGRVSRRVR